MKHSWFPAVIVFATVLSVGYFIGAPIYCRGGFQIPIAMLDRAQVCAGPEGLTRSASMLFYFASVGLALFVGIIADRLPRRAARVDEPKKLEDKTAAPAKEAVEPAAVAIVAPSVAAIAEAPKTDAATPAVAPAAAPVVAAPAPTPAPAPAPTPASTPAPIDLAAAVEAALKVNNPAPKPTPTPAAASAPVVAPPPPVPTPTIAHTPAVQSAPLVMPPAPVLPPPSKPAPLAKPWHQKKAFDGTNEELVARIKELTKEGGVEAIATAQRNLDESTLSALGSGIDPKQHLSQIAHLLLIDDPELKSEVARGVIVHVAARLKELGVVSGLPA